MLADPRDRGGVAVIDVKARSGSTRTLDEQLHRLEAAQILEGMPALLVGRCHGWHSPGDLTPDAEHVPACGEDAHARAVPQERIHQPCRRCDEMLAVVEHAEEVACFEHPDQRLGWGESLVGP